MSKSNFEMNHAMLETGISQILGLAPLPAPERVGEPCQHISDGFIYDDPDDVPFLTTVTKMCKRCGCHYETPNDVNTTRV